MRLRYIFKVLDATKKQKELITNWANKAGKDPTKIIEWVESTFKSDAEQFAAAKWVIKGYDPKVFAQALYICQQKKLDPQGQNPEELVANNADIKKKEKPINPDTCLTDKQEDGEGNVTYAARDEDMETCRQIVDTHFGVDANPWCLLQAKNGELTEGAHNMWEHYSAYPKRIAFRNGKLIAFSAGTNPEYREWWDRQDRSFPFIPYNGKKWEGVDGYVFEIKNGNVYRYSDDTTTARLSNEYSENIEYSDVDIELDRKQQVIVMGDREYPYVQDAKGNYVVDTDTLKCTVSPDLFLEGEYQSFWDNGNPCVKTSYKNGKKDGECQSFYEDGQLQMKCFYKNGELFGEFQSFHENGQPWVKCFYKNGKKEGQYQSFHENGNLQEKCTYKNDKMDGEYQSFYENGQLYVKCFYKNGELFGEFQSFRENGQPWVKCSYKNDKMDGEYQSFHENGNLQEKCTYKNDKMDGEYQSFYDNGQLHEKCSYKNDKKEGECLNFTESGQLREKCTYKNGKRVYND